MHKKHEATASRSRLKTVAQYTPALAGSLALGAGLTASGETDASLIITDIDQTVTPGNHLVVDLDNDSTGDFVVYVADDGTISINAGKNPGVSIFDNVFNLASMLDAGDQVDTSWFDGSSGQGHDVGVLFYPSSGGQGNWSTIGAHGFLALSLNVSGATHYGWLEVTHGSAIVGRAGYETDAGTAAPIPTDSVPEPGSLALLATGAAGLLGLRRRRRGSGALH